MYKYFLILFFIFFAFDDTKAYTVNGGVVYTVNYAREISFKDVRSKIDISPYTKYFYDFSYEKNQQAISKKRFKFHNRFITSFSDKKYCITYTSMKYTTFYYDEKGNLIAIGFLCGDNYPKKHLTYDSSGNLLDLTLVVSGSEQFVFNLDKSLQSHWIGKNCYNEQGELIMTRE